MEPLLPRCAGEAPDSRAVGDSYKLKCSPVHRTGTASLTPRRGLNGSLSDMRFVRQP